MTDTPADQDDPNHETDDVRSDRPPPGEGAVGGPEPTPNLPPGRSGDIGAER